ncbi:MAG: ATP-binding protein [Nitrospira sp.]|nr:ATP-binding protein [Nitrospira sp.]
MLIEFTISNFKSIKEEQTFSLVASKNKELMDSHTFDVRLSEQSSMKLLRSVAIYGPNAAGKTNLVRALRVMETIVRTSALEKSRGDTLPVVPFKLHRDSRQAPSTFEVVFLVDGIRYQYGFSATKERIFEEWLSAFPRNRVQRWFKRTWNADEQKHDWAFGTFLTGEKALWQKSTRDNALFLSTAVQLNSQQLQPVYDWFNNTLYYSDNSDILGLEPIFSASFCAEGGDKRKIIKFLNEADLGIDDVRITKEIFNLKNLSQDMPDSFKQVILKEMKNEEIYDVKTIHQDSDGESIEFDLEDESDGTRKIFALAGPFLDSLERGHVVFIDELPDNLHPGLVKFLVGLFNNKGTNLGNAQLVFTTHETHILNQTILRRDQIWFCEKDSTRATQVFPLTDFRPRKMRENLEAAYLSGRYGALPYVPERQT